MLVVGTDVRSTEFSPAEGYPLIRSRRVGLNVQQLDLRKPASHPRARMNDKRPAVSATLGGGLGEKLAGVDRPPRRPVLRHLIHRQGEGRVETMFVAVGVDLLAELVLVVRAVVTNRVGLPAQSTRRTSGGYGPGIPGGSGGSGGTL